MPLTAPKMTEDEATAYGGLTGLADYEKVVAPVQEQPSPDITLPQPVPTQGDKTFLPLDSAPTQGEETFSPLAEIEPAPGISPGDQWYGPVVDPEEGLRDEDFHPDTFLPQEQYDMRMEIYSRLLDSARNNPDQFSARMKLAEDSGIPSDLFDDPKVHEEAQRLVDTLGIEEVLKRADPAMRDFVFEGDNLSLIRDDLGNAEETWGILRKIGENFIKGYNTYVFGEKGFEQMTWDKLQKDPKLKAEIEAMEKYLADAGQRGKGETWLGDAFYGLFDFLGQMTKMTGRELF